MRWSVAILCVAACGRPAPTTSDAPASPDAPTDASPPDAPPPDAPPPDAAPQQTIVTATGSPVGAGTIAFDPACTPCSGGCCYDVGTQITLTASASAGYQFASWSDSSCGTGPTCTFTTTPAPVTIEALFAPTTAGFSIDFTGDGPGDVLVVQQQSHDVGGCTASCTVAVDPTMDVEVVGASPADFVGFGAPCTAGAHDCVLTAGTSSVTVDFTKRVGEIDLALGGTSVDYDDAGELLVDGVTVFTPALAVKWTTALAGPARFDPAGDVFVLASDGVHKLDPNGAPLWTHTSATTIKAIAPTPTGGVALLHDAGIEIWDANGDPIAMTSIDMAPALCVAVGRDGAIYAGHTGFASYAVIVEAFDASGNRQLPDFPSGSDTSGYYSNENQCYLAAGSTQLAAGVKGELGDWAGVERTYTSTRAYAGGTTYQIPQNMYDLYWPFPEGVAINAADVVAWFAPDPDQNVLDGAVGLYLEKRANPDALVWSVDRPALRTGNQNNQVDIGLHAKAVAISPDGRVAVTGIYYGAGRSYLFLEVFAP